MNVQSIKNGNLFSLHHGLAGTLERKFGAVRILYINTIASLLRGARGAKILNPCHFLSFPRPPGLLGEHLLASAPPRDYYYHYKQRRPPRGWAGHTVPGWKRTLSGQKIRMETSKGAET